MKENKKTSQVAGTTSEDRKDVVNEIILHVLEQKLDSLLIADKYHRILHTVYILLLLVLILFR